jgi:hypothetical protein
MITNGIHIIFPDAIDIDPGNVLVVIERVGIFNMVETFFFERLGANNRTRKSLFPPPPAARAER